MSRFGWTICGCRRVEVSSAISGTGLGDILFCDCGLLSTCIDINGFGADTFFELVCLGRIVDGLS